MACCCDNRTNRILANHFAPELLVWRKCGPIFCRYPVASRFAAGTVATISGLLKPFLIPLMSAVGILRMPIMAAIKMEKGDVEGTRAYLKGWGICFLSVAGTVAFLGVTAFCMPLVWSIALVVSICAFSVVIHVQKSMKTP